MLIKALNQDHLGSNGDPEIQTRIASYEMAYRMQSSVPDIADIAKEPESIREMYGVQPGQKSFANNCLLARRLVERGVRFVQLYHRGWDTHGTSSQGDIVNRLPALCRETDQAAAALVRDLKQRGLLDSTVVVWGGEFGRTPMNEARNQSKFLGRDHHPHAYTMWLAGGGIQARTAVWRNRRTGLQHRRGSRRRARSPCHYPAPDGHGPYAANVPVPGPRLPPDGCRRQCLDKPGELKGSRKNNLAARADARGGAGFSLQGRDSSRPASR